MQYTDNYISSNKRGSQTVGHSPTSSDGSPSKRQSVSIRQSFSSKKKSVRNSNIIHEENIQRNSIKQTRPSVGEFETSSRNDARGSLGLPKKSNQSYQASFRASNALMSIT